MARRLISRPAGQERTTLQAYLLDRLRELEDRRQILDPAFRDHPIGRLNAAAIDETLDYCRWAGVAREADRVVRKAPVTVPA